LLKPLHRVEIPKSIAKDCIGLKPIQKDCIGLKPIQKDCIGLKPYAIEIGRGYATRIQSHSDERFDGAW
jgi:hypothetical protein